MSRYHNIFLIFSLFLYVTTPFARAEECISKNRHIVILDRTSVMNDQEKKSFTRGVEYLISDNKITGKIDLFEISDSSVSYESKFNTTKCLQPFYVDQEKIPQGIIPDECKEQNMFDMGVLDKFFYYLLPKSKSFADEEIDKMCKEFIVEYQAEEKNKRKELVEKIKKIALEDAKPSDTALLTSITEILSTRCPKDDQCSVYIFSNLLDSNIKEMGTSSNSRDRGKSDMEKLVNERGSNKNINNIQVWGFGFDDRDGGKKKEITQDQRTFLSSRPLTAFFC